MKRLARHRLMTVLALGCVVLPARPALAVRGQDDSPTAVLLSRARTLEQRGRLDLAKQDWAQVLLIEPQDAEALAGLVRAARAEGRSADATAYLARLRAAHPNDPELTRLQESGSARDAAADLSQAARLARSGNSAAAMALYRRVYGLNPPAGEPALAYYELEAATADGRPHAIAGLRAMADRFPDDTRYQIALGRVLLESPRTRAEGRTLLERFPDSEEAVAALHGGSSGAERAATQAVPGSTPKPVAPPVVATARVPGPTLPRPTVPPRAEPAGGEASARSSTLMRRTSATSAPVNHHQAVAVEEQAAFAALNEHRQAEAEQRFRSILAKDPTAPRALAGMGYLREVAGDLKTAVTYFEQAQENGDHSLALTRALVNAQFELALQEAAAARSGGNLAGAEVQYRAALRERPSDPGAIEGFGGVLLQEGRAADAIPVFTHLTQVRPMDPGAWRGLIVAEVRAGQGAAALATAARIPADAKSPLAQDATYLQALGSARQSGGVELSRVEPPPPATVASAPKPATAIAAPAVKAPEPRAVASATPSQPPSRAGEAGTSPRRAGASGNSRHAETPAISKPAPAVAQPATVPTVASRPNEVIASERVEQANALLAKGEDRGAAALFQDALAKQPGRADALKGLVIALHGSGQDTEAASVLNTLPGGVHASLGRDATFDGAAGAVYLRTEQPTEALAAFARAQDVFATQRLRPPLELALQIARLLAARQDDADLYRELMYLGERTDLSDAQRRQVQMIWTEWAVRRARSLAVAGDTRRAVVVLNAAAEAFAGNGEVLRTVATGYAGVGRAKEAVALLKTQDLSQAPARDVEEAVGAAITAHDFKAAETWLRLGLARFGNNPEMLTVAAELEQARGHEKRAVELSQQAKSLAPPQDPGQVLAAELREARAGAGSSQRPVGQLTVLLMPAEAAALANAGQSGRPFLPVSAERPPSTSAPESTAAPVLSAYEEPSR